MDEDLFGKSYVNHTIHKLTDGSGLQSILLGNESSGTRKMLALYEYVLDHGSVMFVDELNDRLHPLLVRNIILSFLTPEININHVQLILTSHDVWQFSNTLLRRDELWITDKNRDGVSSLCSVADFQDEEGRKIRRNEAIAKNSLIGSYGGIPARKPLVMMKGVARMASKRRDRNGRFATRNLVLGYYLIVTDTKETEKTYFEGLKTASLQKSV